MKRSQLRKYILYTIVGIGLAIAAQTYVNIRSLPRKFELKGKIDECCCDAELLNDVNSRVVNISEKLSETLFFKIFKVNLFNDCPFWVQEFLCTSPNNKCKICQCDDHEVPLPWKEDKSSIMKSLQDASLQWEPAKAFMWHAEEKDNDKGIYVDLKKNPEVFTGYQGQNVWTVIYGENCFKGDDMCIEERMLNRIISGLHTSISTQLCEYYNDVKNKTYPNFQLFFQKVGDHPERMSNLYFAHSVLLRAINRAHKQIRDYNYDTGNFKEDIETKRLINELYEISLSSCDSPFDEKELFANLSRVEVNHRFISYFHNISRIMDCVECETCKVYGKLQTYGIAAALKILFAEKFTGESEVHLKRNELIALMVTFYKFSTSISYIDKMFERRYRTYMGMFQDISVVVIVFFSVSWLLVKMFNDRVGRVQGQIRENIRAYDHLADETANSRR